MSDDWQHLRIHLEDSERFDGGGLRARINHDNGWFEVALNEGHARTLDRMDDRAIGEMVRRAATRLYGEATDE